MARYGAKMAAALVAAAMLAKAALAAGPAAAPKQADDPFLAAVGVSTDRDALKAAEQATRSMMAKLRLRNRRPAVAVFLDRAPSRPAAEGKATGDRVKELAGAATFGAGGQSGVVGVTWWAKQDYEPTFLVLGMCGAGVKATAYAAGGPIPTDGQAAEKRAEALGRQVRPLQAGGLALFLGGIPYEAWVRYPGALRDAVPAEVPLLAAVGRPGDYVYADGRKLLGDGGKETPVGQLIVAIEGELDVAFAGICSRNEADGQAVLEEADAVAGHAARMLGDRKPELVLAFSGEGRLRTSSLSAPGRELTRLRAAFGKDASIFGCFTPVQVGVDNEGRVSIGPCRLMLAAIAQRPTKER